MGNDRREGDNEGDDGLRVGKMTEGDGGRDLSDGWIGLRSMMSLAAAGFSLLSLPFPYFFLLWRTCFGVLA